jgi:hypothetical protein
MMNFLEMCFTGPNVVASGVVLFILAFWMISMIGGLGFDALDLDVDTSLDTDGLDSILGIGMVPLRWLNLGAIPLMLWLTVFGLIWWGISLGFYAWYDQDWVVDRWDAALSIGRNVLLALVPTKLLTQPLIGLFSDKSTNTTEELVGRAEITKMEITTKQGQVNVTSDGAVLVLDARTTDGHIATGQRVVVTAYDSSRRLFIVEPTTSDEE